MYKKKGFALLQTLVVLIIVLLLVSISINLISFNYLKSQTFNSYNDKRSLNMEEENVLKAFNKELQKGLKPDTSIGKYTYIIKENKHYIIKTYNSSKKYIEVEMKEHNGNKILIPTYYKTDYIVGGS